MLKFVINNIKWCLRHEIFLLRSLIFIGAFIILWFSAMAKFDRKTIVKNDVFALRNIISWVWEWCYIATQIHNTLFSFLHSSDCLEICREGKILPRIVSHILYDIFCVVLRFEIHYVLQKIKTLLDALCRVPENKFWRLWRITKYFK